ncbi:MAG: hypothetical protein C4541_05765 [Candidatus Auribacter fodinae]|uniref:Uncharacterized protein n=1 Tax=Candidatus Auribacter fodinae TaxID=2093366 RepID=A0A3A4R073_9BACT|nr:MAG: hypothetical protein C4541_05765 [Candidatus Auribacter fodinae]
MSRNKTMKIFTVMTAVLLLAGSSLYAQCSYSGGGMKSKDKSSESVPPQSQSSQSGQEEESTGTTTSQPIQGDTGAQGDESN